MRRDRQRPAYLWMLAGIIALYAAIIILGNSDTGGVVRVALLGFLVWNAARLRTEAGHPPDSAGDGRDRGRRGSHSVRRSGPPGCSTGVVGGCSVVLIATRDGHDRLDADAGASSSTS